jgi:hypothetical protein
MLGEKIYPEHNTDQALVGVHDSSKCSGRPCPIHNLSNHHMRSFVQVWRSDIGIMERVCEHGIGHPDPDSPWEEGADEWIHGCDGCCQQDDVETSKYPHPENLFVIKELFEPDVHQSIIDFLNEKSSFLHLDFDKETFNRRHGHNIPFLKDIHDQMGDYASEIFGERLKPSYCFLSMYENGGICPLHLDRPQCYRTIDYLVWQESNQPWLIRIGKHMSDEEVHAINEHGQCHYDDLESASAVISSEQWTEIHLSPNEAVCYSGTNSWHYRPELSKGKCYLVFFHFVKEDFDGPLS